ncbi:hypothetical protein Hanom_Chr02g00165221 [Helianthus anomalus]
MKGVSTFNCCRHKFATFTWFDNRNGIGSRWITKISISCMRMIFRNCWRNYWMMIIRCVRFNTG